MAASPDALAEVFGPDILGRIASFLPPNEVACTLRLVSRSTAGQLREHAVVRWSQPFPAWAGFAAHWSTPGACRTLSCKRRQQLLCLTAASGDVGNLEVALAAVGLCPNREVMAAAAAAGQLHVCRWLAERGCPLEGSCLALGEILLDTPLMASAKGGHAEICEWLLEQGCVWTEECVTSAARGGHLELMRALLRKAPPGPRGNVFVESLLCAAAEGCDLGTFQELWREWAAEGSAGVDRQRVRSFALTAAASSPTPDWAAKLAWLLEQGAVQRPESIAAAAASCPDALARLTLLVDGMGLPVDAAALDAAACEGRAEAVRWMLARGLPAFTHGVIAASNRGHTEVLRAVHAAGWRPPQSYGLIVQACWSGNVETVSWFLETFGHEALHAEGPGDGWVVPGVGSKPFDKALSSGSLELVTWLRERGVGLGPYPWSSAVWGGCVAVLELLAEWGAEVQAPEDQYLNAARRGDLLTLEALRRLGLPLGRTPRRSRALVSEAISGSTPLPALRWLREAVGDVNWAMAARAARDAFERVPGWRAQVQAWVQAEAGPVEEGAEEDEEDEDEDEDEDEEGDNDAEEWGV